MDEKTYYVYILSNITETTFYIGVTSDLLKRMYEHKNGVFDGFTKRYHIHKLLYYEVFRDINEAIFREKKLKRWHKEWKWNLITTVNPNHINLFVNNEIHPIKYE